MVTLAELRQCGQLAFNDFQEDDSPRRRDRLTRRAKGQYRSYRIYLLALAKAGRENNS